MKSYFKWETLCEKLPLWGIVWENFFVQETLWDKYFLRGKHCVGSFLMWETLCGMLLYVGNTSVGLTFSHYAWMTNET